MHTSENLLLAWMLASNITSIQPHHLEAICNKHKLSLFNLLNLNEAGWRELQLPEKSFQQLQATRSNTHQAFEKIKRHGFVSLTYSDKHYPTKLKQLERPPCVLFIKGSVENLSKPQVSIVGSRMASRNGCSLASEMAGSLADSGIHITSGLARGIDAAAHTGALANGKTNAILGTGIDVCYPKYNQKLSDEIVANGGTLVTEFLPGTPPRAHHFPCRNRIVAALSLGVLVVEAKLRSGSLITANLAADMGRDVFAVPGNVQNPLSEGVNWLIQQGAKLVTKPADVLEELGGFVVTEGIAKKTNQKALATDTLLDSVDYDVTFVDDIAKRSKLPTPEVLAALLEYELRGLVAAVPGGYIKLRGK